MEHKKMKVTMTDGVGVLFIKDGTINCKIYNSMGHCGGRIQEDSIHAVVGDQLRFNYYYDKEKVASVHSMTLVKEIVCE